MVRHYAFISVGLIFIKRRNSVIFQVIYTLSKSWLMLERRRILKIINTKVFPKADIKHTISIFSDIKVVCIKHLHIDVVSCIIKQMEKVFYSF